MLNLRNILTLLFVLFLGSVARAEPATKAAPTDADKPPIAIGGWRYTKEPNGLYSFYCERPDCAPRSKVSYRLYAPNMPMTLDEFRAGQEMTVRTLRERAAPGSKIEIVSFEGSDGRKDNDPLRVFKVHRLHTDPDGTRLHYTSSIIIGPRLSVSLISSSTDKKKNDDAYTLFAVGLMLAAAVDPSAKSK